MLTVCVHHHYVEPAGAGTAPESLQPRRIEMIRGSVGITSGTPNSGRSTLVSFARDIDSFLPACERSERRGDSVALPRCSAAGPPPGDGEGGGPSPSGGRIWIGVVCRLPSAVRRLDHRIHVRLSAHAR